MSARATTSPSNPPPTTGVGVGVVGRRVSPCHWAAQAPPPARPALPGTVPSATPRREHAPARDRRLSCGHVVIGTAPRQHDHGREPRRALCSGAGDVEYHQVYCEFRFWFWSMVGLFFFVCGYFGWVC